MKSLSIYFSPTGGGEKIARAIQQALDNNDGDCLYSLNLTKRPLAHETEQIDHDSIPVILTFPVYGGHMPQIVKERFEQLRSSHNQPAVIVAVYGNRAFENALTDIEAFVRTRGFNPIAAAAFPCEHSYSSRQTPIAHGRPDSTDLADARLFGWLVREKLLCDDMRSINPAELHDIPSPEASVKNFIGFVKEYQARQAVDRQTYIPVTDSGRCIDCQNCIQACPTDAISADMSTDASRCIKCCACVKICPTEARTFHSPFATTLSANFSLRKPACWIL